MNSVHNKIGYKNVAKSLLLDKFVQAIVNWMKVFQIYN